ncbi:alpha/beta fold hydrolase [Chitinasiproducens palmae]|nr:alpha/beta fold hydrolase [Chitinasiproducens palmae]
MAAHSLQEKTFEFEGMEVAYLQGGTGSPLLLIHGSGPGASSLGNWRTVLPALTARHQVFAMDLIGFGRSPRRPTPPYFDLALWVRQARAMLARIDAPRVGIIGHSISGAIALRLAALEKRVAAVLTTGTMGRPFEATDATRRCWTCPTDRQTLIATLRGLIHDPSVIDEPYLAAREPVLFAPGYANYFDAMFEQEPAHYIAQTVLDDATLAAISCPVTLLHGRDDVAFPPSSSIGIAASLRRADLVLLSECSHSVAFERTDMFLACAETCFSRLALD